MKRDFSADAKRTLFGLIDEVNDEKWNDFTDWLGDHSVFAGANIQNYLDDVNKYHKKIFDKNNTAKDDITVIFNNVFLVDYYYSRIFSAYNQAIKEQVDYIKALGDCINPNGTSLNIESMKKIMDEKIAKIQSVKVKIYIEKLRSGASDGKKYDYELIKEVMSKDPKDVEPEMYIALISVFDEMSCEEKSEFIENCYIEDTFSTMGIEDTARAFVLSDVFSTMVSVCGSITTQLDAENEENTKFLSNYNLLYAISAHANNIITSPFFSSTIVDIQQATFDGHNDYDYRVEFRGASSFYNWYMKDYKRCTLDVYQSRGTTSQDGVFDEHVKKIAEYFRVNSKLENTKTTMDFAESVAMTFFATNPVSIGFSVVKTASDISMNTIKAKESNDRVDKISSLLDDGNTYNALTIDTYFSFDSDGNYAISSYSVDSDKLKSRLRIWNDEFNESDPINVENVIKKIQSGNFDDLNEIDSYLDWYCHNGGADELEKRGIY